MRSDEPIYQIEVRDATESFGTYEHRGLAAALREKAIWENYYRKHGLTVTITLSIILEVVRT